ncbi:MAG: YceI family protein [Elusimicrobia bacterium]|nr:YceI family protein [Elusimicrobiota bacterium]
MAVLLVSAAAPLRAADYVIDPDHSTVMFRVRHLVGHVMGQFNKFEGTFSYEKGKPASWKTQASIDAASIDTKVEKRDGHLRSPDFFDVEKHPKITFVSTKISDMKGSRAKLWGKLTILETTKTIPLDLEINGVTKDKYGREHAGFTATGKIDRKDFGLTWNSAVEAGGVLVGDEVKMTLEIEGLLQEKSETKGDKK